MVLPSLLIAASLFDIGERLHASPPAVTESTSITGTGELDLVIAPVADLGSIPRGARRIPVATVNASASCDADVVIESVRLRHVGRGDAADISALWLGDDVRRYGRSARFSSSSTVAVLRLNGVTIPRCDARRFTVYMDLEATALPAAEHAVRVVDASDVVSSAAVTRLATEDPTERVLVTPYDDARLRVNVLPVRSRLAYGRRMTVARLQVTGDARRPLLLQSITLTNEEDARDMDLRNFALQTRSGEVLSGPALRMRGRTVRLEVVPTYRIDRAQTLVLDVVADVYASGYRKARFIVQEPSDIVVLPARTRP